MPNRTGSDSDERRLERELAREKRFRRERLLRQALVGAMGGAIAFAVIWLATRALG